ncbi:biotin synthase [Anaplasma marginale str. Dawn]|uniref:Biotin synthase n=4 Tax=Anaplasma TaxID=768 RepID=BIOB_ANAMF|nr:MULTISPECIES: biotin synthase BioB [Anaplasma]B9KGM2.1 RecName: Full=Biotin synthase [Anaplasma marginale str. Florida]Q5PA14.1 RecName: Full=Biotin synthase [Anaplasma marginale str. St. Maries]AAV86866.1 biotin synthase [Anaplasma marginale str. St. Maries]ACM49576.1 biotin synthase (bioB) [Anaplasma marginale str. Florida]ACZ49011.1 biotin synthase [Anaplasma centrale str. Israel]AGZ79068.1 biotin synthase [Anaplasma marginale str. Gypsy Plains]AGZ79875.1 biotin synthase [Anaplasma mar
MIRNNWTLEEALELFRMPFSDLILKAHSVHVQNFRNNEVQVAALMNIKTGSCPENCRYCAQSAHYNTGLEKKSLSTVEEVKTAAKRAKEIGADRFCFAAAWRNLHDRDLEKICQFVEAIKSEGLESCASLGMLKLDQAQKLKESGLDFYNHNVDTSREFYHNVVTTRTYEERLETVRNVQQAGIKVCCGGILGMGESTEDRASMLVTLANLEQHPLSVPINRLVPIEGTPMEGNPKIDNIDFVRTIAVARIMMPASYVRLAAGRGEMSEEMQALCMLAGANSIFCGEKLLTTPNARPEDDQRLFSQLGITPSRAACTTSDAQLA